MCRRHSSCEEDEEPPYVAEMKGGLSGMSMLDKAVYGRSGNAHSPTSNHTSTCHLWTIENAHSPTDACTCFLWIAQYK